jgi:hypothetical protein
MRSWTLGVVWWLSSVALAAEIPGGVEAPASEAPPVEEVTPAEAPLELDAEAPAEPALEAVDPAEASPPRDPSTGKAPGQASTRLSSIELRAFHPKIRAGRTTTWVSWGMLAAGTVLIPASAALRVYDPPDDWTKVWRYQRSFLVREEASTPLLGIGIGLAGASIPVQTAGVMLEARALARVTGRRPIVGWVGTGLVISGLTVGGALAPIPTVAMFFAPLVLSGWGCIIGQWIFNMRIEQGLDDRTRDLLYERKLPVELAVVPVLGRTPGLSVVGRF